MPATGDALRSATSIDNVGTEIALPRGMEHHPTRRGSRLCRLAFMALCVWALAPAALSALPVDAAPINFEALQAFARTSGALSIAADGQEVLVGDDRGALSSVQGRLPERLARGAAVRDMAFDAAGRLWLATDDGLLLRSGRVIENRGPGPGAARSTRRLLVVNDVVFVASAQGVYLVQDGAARALPGRVGRALRGEVDALAWLPEAEGGLLAALADGDLYEVRIEADMQALNTQRVPGDSRFGDFVDIAALDGRLWLLGERGVALRTSEGFRPGPLGLPPGVSVKRLALHGERLWVASDQGLLVAELGGARFERAPGAIGRSEIGALAALAGRLYVAAERGAFVLGGEEARAREAAGLRPGVDVLRAPSIAALHAAVIRAQGLGQKHLGHWRHRVRSSGRRPEVDFSVGYGGDRSRDDAWDQSFITGDYRNTHDRDRSRGRDFELDLTLSWDLGAARAHPEEVDVAREVREWIELRDEILDEVDQLYFERLRVLHERAGLAADDPKAALLGIRARELSAGLDAWTLGWWSRNAPDDARLTRGAARR